MFRLISLFLISVLAVLVSGCNAQITRNADRSLNIDVTLPAATIEAEVAAAVADSQLDNASVELHDGFITVTAERPRPNGNRSDAISFRLDLGVADGSLTANISNLLVNGQPADAATVANLNDQIAAKLMHAGQSRPNSSLAAVSVTPAALNMTWRIERGG